MKTKLMLVSSYNSLDDCREFVENFARYIRIRRSLGRDMTAEEDQAVKALQFATAQHIEGVDGKPDVFSLFAYNFPVALVLEWEAYRAAIAAVKIGNYPIHTKSRKASV